MLCVLFTTELLFFSCSHPIILFSNATLHQTFFFCLYMYISCLFFFVESHIHDSGLLDFHHKWRNFGFIKSRATSSIANAVSMNQWCWLNPAALSFRVWDVVKDRKLASGRNFMGPFIFMASYQGLTQQRLLLVIIGWLCLKLCIPTL